MQILSCRVYIFEKHKLFWKPIQPRTAYPSEAPASPMVFSGIGFDQSFIFLCSVLWTKCFIFGLFIIFLFLPCSVVSFSSDDFMTQG